MTSRIFSSGWRKSTVKNTSPGMTLRLLGRLSIKPTVPTASGTSRAIAPMRSTIWAAPTSASLRSRIGIAPACASCPVIVTSYQRTPCAPCTMPIIRSSRSRIGPCSMCSSNMPANLREDRMIGIVQGAQGVRWYEVTITGQEAHAGAMPMRLRKDALVGAAQMIERIDAIARDVPDAVGTVGLIESRPNSRNVIPGEVFFTVDFRHPDEKIIDIMERQMHKALAEVLPPQQLAYRKSRIWASPPVHFSPDRIFCVRVAVESA